MFGMKKQEGTPLTMLEVGDDVLVQMRRGHKGERHKITKKTRVAFTVNRDTYWRNDGSLTGNLFDKYPRIVPAPPIEKSDALTMPKTRDEYLRHIREFPYDEHTDQRLSNLVLILWNMAAEREKEGK